MGLFLGGGGVAIAAATCVVPPLGAPGRACIGVIAGLGGASMVAAIPLLVIDNNQKAAPARHVAITTARGGVVVAWTGTF